MAAADPVSAWPLCITPSIPPASGPYDCQLGAPTCAGNDPSHAPHPHRASEPVSSGASIAVASHAFAPTDTSADAAAYSSAIPGTAANGSFTSSHSEAGAGASATTAPADLRCRLHTLCTLRASIEKAVAGADAESACSSARAQDPILSALTMVFFRRRPVFFSAPRYGASKKETDSA